MTAYELPASEWSRLTDTTFGPVLDQMPADMRVLVVEDVGQIVGCWSLYTAVHVEGLWIHPAYRSTGSVARRLLTTMQGWVQALGVSGVLTSACEPVVEGYLTRIGAEPIPGTPYYWPVKG